MGDHFVKALHRALGNRAVVIRNHTLPGDLDLLRRHALARSATTAYQIPRRLAEHMLTVDFAEQGLLLRPYSRRRVARPTWRCCANHPRLACGGTDEVTVARTPPTEFGWAPAPTGSRTWRRLSPQRRCFTNVALPRRRRGPGDPQHLIDWKNTCWHEKRTKTAVPVVTVAKP